VTDKLPYEAECEECAYLRRLEKVSREACDRSKEVDARVMGRRHLRNAHGIVVEVQE
jgi:hypothetical protein